MLHKHKLELELDGGDGHIRALRTAHAFRAPPLPRPTGEERERVGQIVANGGPECSDARD